jgi:tetratricopeptide (TPR) repeat protein
MPVDEKLLEAAEGYLELGLAEPALAALKEVSRPCREEDPFTYHSLAGEANRLLEKYDRALPHFLKAKESRPTATPVHVSLGWCYKRLGQLDQAIDVLEEAQAVARPLGVDSSLALILYNLACYYSLASNKEKMLERLTEALSIEPGFRHGIADESDFDPFRNDPQFIQVVSEII